MYDPTHPDRFPPPQTWLVWQADYQYKYKTVEKSWTDANGNTTTYEQREIDEVIDLGHGKIRHKTTLADARKHCSYVARDDNPNFRGRQVRKGAWFQDWKIFEWIDGEWVLRYEGFAGQMRKDHELWARGVAKRLREVAGPPPAEAYALEVVKASMQAAS
jgi:hypothetical protein